MKTIILEKGAGVTSPVTNVGVCLSLCCAVHCVIQILLLPLLPVAGMALPLGGMLEPLLLGAALLLALWNVMRGFAIHRAKGVFALLGLAASLIAVGLIVGHDSEAWEMGLIVGGALMLAATQYWDHSLRRKCACCETAALP